MAFPSDAGKDHRFKPGWKGGPGRPKGIIRADEVKALMGRFWNMTRVDLKAVVDDQKATMGEIMVAAVMVKAAKDGDYSRLSFLLDRAIGRVRPEDDGTAANSLLSVLELLASGGITIDQIVAHLGAKKQA